MNPNLLPSKLCVVLLILLCQSVLGQVGELQTSLSRLMMAERDDYEKLVEAILKSSPSHAQIATAALYAEPIESEVIRKLPTGWSEWKATDENGVTRPYQAYVPEAISQGKVKTAALIMHIHGAVSRPEFGTGKGSPMAVGYAGMLWPKVADAENYVIVCPLGRTECAWWTDNGVLHMDAVLRDVRRRFKYPESMVFAAGFSDGASGCYYRSLAAPGSFAGFIAMNGHFAVGATASGKQLYLPNAAMRPILAAMTHNDSLYPSKSMLPHITKALQHGGDILAVAYPKMNHQPSYFQEQLGAIKSFMTSNSRKPKSRIRWYAADASTGKCDWLEILEFEEPSNAMKMPEFNVKSTPGRVRLGVALQDSNVREVIEGGAAQSAGLQKDDEITSFDGAPVASSRELRSLLSRKSHGDAFVVEFKRDGETVKANGRFPKFVPKPVYSRKRVTAMADVRLESESVDIEIETKNAKRLRIWLPGNLSEKKELAILVNGEPKNVVPKKLGVREYLLKIANATETDVRYAYIELADF